MNFLDINKAHRDGYFGKNPRIWGDRDLSLLIDYLSGGIEFTPEEWGNVAYEPQVWSTIENARTKAPPATRGNILNLKSRALHQGDNLKHMCGMKKFLSCDALSTITESTAEGDAEDRSEASFARLDKQLWTTAMRNTVPAIKAKARNPTAASLGAVAGKVRRAERTAKRKVAKHESIAASSSGK